MIKENISIKRDDLRLLMVTAFRYSLERRVYTPSFIVDLIIKNHEMFKESDWKRFVKEINEESDLGNTIDILTWNKFIHFCENKIKEMNNK
jgi:hypothetical protein